MRATDYENFDELSYEALLSGRQQKSWLWLGLIMSLIIHLMLCMYFYRTRFQTVDPSLLQAQQTPTCCCGSSGRAPRTCSTRSWSSGAPRSVATSI